MQFFIAALIGAFGSAMGSLVGRVLLYLGISFVTYTGYNVTIDWLNNQVKESFAALPADVLAFLGWLWVDKAIGVLFAAYAASAAIGVGAGSIKKMVMK